jgi:hypothetical protein
MTQADDASQPSAPVAELRAAPRSSLMFRTAKLLGESGEYVCVVRDVSASGCRIRLFHEAPADSHLFLELANGDRYAMERVWAREDHLGFRFSCAIDVDRFIAEPSAYPRRPIRLNLRRPADVVVDGVASPAVLLDLSQHGARIESGRKFALEQKLWLGIDDVQQRFGCVRWRNGYTHGVVLQQSLRLDELALYAFDLQSGERGAGRNAAPTALAGFG